MNSASQASLQSFQVLAKFIPHTCNSNLWFCLRVDGRGIFTFGNRRKPGSDIRQGTAANELSLKNLRAQPPSDGLPFSEVACTSHLTSKTPTLYGTRKASNPHRWRRRQTITSTACKS